MLRVRWLGVVLLCGVVVAQERPPALPAAGWVNLDKLVQADPAWARAAALVQQAADLRAAAQELAPLTMPEVPAEPSLAPTVSVPLGEEGTDRGRDLELQFLRAAYLSQISGERQRAVELSLPAQERQWLTERARERLAALDLTGAMSYANGAERTNVMLQTGTSLGPLSVAWQTDANALAATEAALSERWRSAGDERAVQALRDRLAAQSAELDAQDVIARAAAEEELERQAETLAALAQRLAEARTGLNGNGQEAVLDLDAWRAELAAAQSEGQAQRARRADRWLRAATVLVEESVRRRAELQANLPGRLRGRLLALAKTEGVSLSFEPTAGQPEVTALAAQWLAALADNPELLAPPLPSSPPQPSIPRPE